MSLLTAEFAKAAAKARPVQWMRFEFDSLRATRSEEQRVREQELLANVMALAKRSAVARAALEWAQAHDIKFMIDFTTTAGGYYTRQTGVVAISHDAAAGRHGMYYAAEVLTHEIRHAWQDHHGLLPNIFDYRGADLGRVTIQQALYEADAYAHGKLAAAQCQGEVGSPLNYLRYHFRNWYAGSPSDIYGVKQREFQGAMVGVKDCTAPNYQTEFKGSPFAQARAGIDPWRREDIEKLGKSFADFNYLSSWKNDRLWNCILSPSSAVCQFADHARAPKLAEAVRVRQLRTRVLQGKARQQRGAKAGAL